MQPILRSDASYVTYSFADRVIGINAGLGLNGETDPSGDWKELQKAEPGTDDRSLSMLLEPMYLLMGRNFEQDTSTYAFERCDEDEATGVIFASEALTEDTDGWSHLEFGQIAFLRNEGGQVTRTVNNLSVWGRSGGGRSTRACRRRLTAGLIPLTPVSASPILRSSGRRTAEPLSLWRA